MTNSTSQTVSKFVSARPREEIVGFVTPLVHLKSLSKLFGVELWMKRDDLAGPSFGGNKARQLEYYFGEARTQQGHDRGHSGVADLGKNIPVASVVSLETITGKALKLLGLHNFLYGRYLFR